MQKSFCNDAGVCTTDATEQKQNTVITITGEMQMADPRFGFGESSVTTSANDKTIYHLHRPDISSGGDSANAKQLLDESSRQHHLDSAQGREKVVNALKNGATSASSSSSYTGMKFQLFGGNPDDVLAFLDKMNKTSEKPEVNEPEPQPQVQTQPKKR